MDLSPSLGCSAIGAQWSSRTKTKQNIHLRSVCSLYIYADEFVYDMNRPTILKLTNVNELLKYNTLRPGHWAHRQLSFQINMQTVINIAFCFDFSFGALCFDV